MSNHVQIRDRKRKGARSEHTPRNRKKRPKTFKSEESAKQWAEKNNVKDVSFYNLKSDSSSRSKIRLIQNNIEKNN